MITKKIIFTCEETEKGKTSYCYVFLREDIKAGKPGESVRQIVFDGYPTKEKKDFKGELIVDLDKDGKIIGIEIIGDLIPDHLKT